MLRKQLEQEFGEDLSGKKDLIRKEARPGQWAAWSRRGAAAAAGTAASGNGAGSAAHPPRARALRCCAAPPRRGRASPPPPAAPGGGLPRVQGGRVSARGVAGAAEVWACLGSTKLGACRGANAAPSNLTLDPAPPRACSNGDAGDGSGGEEEEDDDGSGGGGGGGGGGRRRGGGGGFGQKKCVLSEELATFLGTKTMTRPQARRGAAAPSAGDLCVLWVVHALARALARVRVLQTCACVANVCVCCIRVRVLHTCAYLCV
jgi:hypothetical protein